MRRLGPPRRLFLPYAVRLRGAWRHERLVLRPSVGMSFGGDSPRPIPLLAEMAVLVTWGREQRSSVGIEGSMDLGRLAPFMVGPGISLAIRTMAPVVKIGLAVPLTFGTDGRQPMRGSSSTSPLRATSEGSCPPVPSSFDRGPSGSWAGRCGREPLDSNRARMRAWSC